VIDSHKVTSVVDSVRSKFGQLPKGACGLVYVDVDVSRVVAADRGFYFTMIRHAVEGALATPPILTQAGAVVMTTGLMAVSGRNAQKQPVTVRARGSMVVPNPGGSLPDGFTVADPWLMEKGE